MVWKKIDEEIWDFEKNKELIGVFLGSEDSKKFKGHKNHSFKTVESSLVTVFGTAVLDGKLAAIDVGTKIKIEFLGLVKAKKGGDDYKDFKIFIDVPEDVQEEKKEN